LHGSLLQSGLEHSNFSNVDISQGSVVTGLGCGGMVNNEFVASLLLNMSVKVGQHVAQLRARFYFCVVFDSQCIVYKISELRKFSLKCKRHT